MFLPFNAHSVYGVRILYRVDSSVSRLSAVFVFALAMHGFFERCNEQTGRLALVPNSKGIQ